MYFDDFTVTHVQSGVVQSNNYYPFGLRHATSWTRPEAVPNAFLYNAGSELNEKTKNYETFFRQYDPALGRFTGVDPLAAKFASLSGYHYAYNNPVMFNDPLGDQSYDPRNGYDPWANYRVGYTGSPTFEQMIQQSRAQDYASMGMGHLYNEYQAIERPFAKGYQDNRVKVTVNGKTSYVNSSDIDIFSSSTSAGGETYYHYEIVVGEGNGAQSGGGSRLRYISRHGKTR